MNYARRRATVAKLSMCQRFSLRANQPIRDGQDRSHNLRQNGRTSKPVYIDGLPVPSRCPIAPLAQPDARACVAARRCARGIEGTSMRTALMQGFDLQFSVELPMHRRKECTDATYYLAT